MHSTNAKKIAVVWTIEDVQEIRSDLDDEQAWRVLQACDGNHDANVGINWNVLEEYAELFFPKQTADSS